MGVDTLLHSQTMDKASGATFQAKDNEDWISQLPEHVLQRILSLMPPKDAARTCAASKTWHRARSSRPVSTFRFVCRGEELENTLAANFRDSLSILHKKEAILVNFDVSWPLYRNEYATYMDEWTRLVTRHCVKELRINVAPNRVEETEEEQYTEFLDRLRNLDSRRINSYSLPETTFASAESLVVLRLRGCRLKKQLLGENRKLVSLRVLFLEETFMHGETIKELLSRCPFLEECTIKMFKTVECIKLCKFRRLKQVTLDGFRMIALEDVPALQVLDISNYWSIHGKNCRGIGKLTLKTCESTCYLDTQNFISQLPFLNSMVLKGNIFKIRISSTSVKNITFSSGGWPQYIEIDAPRLSCYEYQGSLLPETSLRRSTFFRGKIKLDLTPRGDDALFFYSLRRNLATLIHYKSTFKLKINCSKFALPPLQLRERHLPPPSFLDSVELQDVWSCSGYTSLIEGLLWSCRPITLSVEPTYIFLKVFQDTIMRRLEGTKLCEDRCTFTCWRFYLEDVRVDTRNGIKDFKNLDNGDLLELQSEGTLRFRLEWSPH